MYLPNIAHRKARKKCRIESKDGTTLNIVDVRNYRNRPRIKKRKNAPYLWSIAYVYVIIQTGSLTREDAKAKYGRQHLSLTAGG